MEDAGAAYENPGGAGGACSIGAGAPLQAVLDRRDCPALFRQALTTALSWQERNRVTIDRVLTSPGIAPQWYAGLLALGASVTIAGKDAQGDVPLEAVLERTVQGKITALHVRFEGVCYGEAHVARTPADEPIVAAAAGVEMENGIVRQARVALTGVWPRPVGLAQASEQLVGGPLDEAAIRRVADGVEAEVAPKGDYRGSEEYRRAMAGVLTRRALRACLAQEVGM